MKKLKFIVALSIGAMLVSCGSTSTDGKEGFSTIESNLKSEFGDNAYYTEISVIYNESIGNIVNATVTKDPESLQMGQWTQSQGNWNQTSEVTIEIPEGTKAADFMFQLKDKVTLTKLGELVEESSKSLTTEKKLENPKLHMVFVKYPDNGDVSQAEYIIMLKPETGGTTFTYSYKLNGELIKMDY